MAVPKKNSKIRYTTYPTSKNKTSKKPFHKPEAYGELIKIKPTLATKILSVVSIVFQAFLSFMVLYAVVMTETIPALEGSGFSTSVIYILFAAVPWILTIGFRTMCRILPIEMWRLPVKVKNAVIFCEGKPLKLATLLLEIAVTGMFLYITLILLVGSTPSIPILIVFVGLLAAAIFFPALYALRTMKAGKAKEKE